jgi:DNA-binding IclR family transcriptional regulator
LPTRRPTAGRRDAANAAGAKTGSANSTADRAIDILLLFSEERPRWLMAEIAAHFDMPRSTIYRYLVSLRSYALIVEDDKGGYRLGPKIFPLAQAARAGTSILNIAQPYLDELNRKFGEAVTLYERIGHESIPLLRLESRHSVKMMHSRGQMLPWPAAASSKALLAFAPPGDQDAIFRLLVPVQFTHTTIRSLPMLRRALNAIQKKGYVYSDQEREEGVRAVAAPIFSRGEGRYCVTMSGPLFRITTKKIPLMIETVCKAASDITEGLKKGEY